MSEIVEQIHHDRVSSPYIDATPFSGPLVIEQYIHHGYQYQVQGIIDQVAIYPYAKTGKEIHAERGVK